MNIKKVAIQGGIGSFHEIAAIIHFGSEKITNVCSNTFYDLIKLVEKQEVDYGILAIENTVAGSLIANYALLESSSITVVAEILLRVEQNLLALPGQSIADIKEVYSHPIALMQCSEFFKNHQHIRLVESEDTAMSAEKIAKFKIPNAGAVASLRAANLFGLQVLSAGIETNKHNFTRFLVIKSKKIAPHNYIQNPDKASISFTLQHKTGSLSQVLSIFSFYNINLTKIQSIPIIGKEWEYHFIVDLTFYDISIYKLAIQAVMPLTSGLQIFGEYKKAEKYYLSNQLDADPEIETIELN